MNPSDPNDPLRNIAWEWVIRQHEQTLDEALRGQLVAWLAESPAHRKCYEEASCLWLASGLVPPPDDSDLAE